MTLEGILPEIYTFLDFTNHECRMAKKKGLTGYSTHIGGEIPAEHPMPYNVYLPVSEYLKKHPEEIDSLIDFLNEELTKPLFNYKKVTFNKASFTFKKSFLSKKQVLPYVTVDIKF